jgi:CRP/FNR family transcriptional regulator
MSRDRHRELLRGTPYFARLDDAALDEVVSVAIARRYGPGERIFTENRGEGAASLHIVESGSVRVFKISSEGREQVLRLMSPGDAFSDVPAFDGGPYPASADAQEPSTVLAIPRQALLDLMEAYPAIAIGALHNVAERLRHMTTLVEDLSLRRVMSRIARLLLEDERAARLTQSQIASMVGTAREMVNRSLHTMEDRGVIAIKGSSIEIVDAGQLAEIVEKG